MFCERSDFSTTWELSHYFIILKKTIMKTYYKAVTKIKKQTLNVKTGTDWTSNLVYDHI